MQNARVVGKGWAGYKGPQSPRRERKALFCEFRNNLDALKAGLPIFASAPQIRRPLDQMNSLLWELSDGSRTFGEICGVMDEVFREEIAPVMQRTAAAIGLFQRNNLALMLDEPLNRRWTVGPGQTPEHQTLAGLSDDLDYDCSPMDGDAP